MPKGATATPYFYVGTAGWSLPKAQAPAFADGASVLERYASRFNGVEINSSFYRPHQRKTYERWAAAVPPGFRFAVKAPKQISHARRLVGATPLMEPFLDQIGGLGGKLGPVLFQLPPSLAFDDEIAAAFFAAWRARVDGPTGCEPRLLSWFSPAAERRLVQDRIARAAADPAVCPEAAISGGFGPPYIRLHGSPDIYQSPYGPERLRSWLRTLADAPGPAWCILDNTMFGAATEDALTLKGLIGTA